jgi:hypothetical protein
MPMLTSQSRIKSLSLFSEKFPDLTASSLGCGPADITMRLAEAVLRWSAGRKRNREDHRISKLAKEFTPSCPFGVKHIIESKLTIEGAGVKLRRAFATSRRARPQCRSGNLA